MLILPATSLIGFSKGSCLVGDGFKCDRHALGSDNAFGQIEIGGKMKIAEDDLPFADHLDLALLRFFDFDDHVRSVKHLFRRSGDFSAVFGIFLVRDAGAEPGAGFDQHLMAGVGEFLRADRNQPDPILVRFDLCGDTDDHSLISNAWS
jgi:hypothetical protein